MGLPKKKDSQSKLKKDEEVEKHFWKHLAIDFVDLVPGNVFVVLREMVEIFNQAYNESHRIRNRRKTYKATMFHCLLGMSEVKFYKNGDTFGLSQGGMVL